MTRRTAALLAACISAGCGSWQRVGTEESAAQPSAQRSRLIDAASIYRAMGELVSGGALPFVASVRYLGGPTPDSTLALVSISLSNHVLSFQRHNAEFFAEYHVEAAFAADSTAAPARQLSSDQEVRVRNFTETVRTDESIIFQQFITVPPGTYQVTVLVRDRNGPALGRAARLDTVPRLTAPAITPPIAVYSARGRADRSAPPVLVANPRATLRYGTDSIRFYLERYGAGPETLVARVVDVGGRELWRDTVRFAGTADLASAIIAVTPAKLPVGQAEVQITPAGSADTTRAPFLVSFANQWVITNYDDMVSLLRYFDRPDWVDSLRRAPADRRPEVWHAFWQQTDPNPLTPENELLDDYLRRVQAANVRFIDEGEPGWLTERGEVFICLGEPDEMLDLSNGLDRSGLRVIRWTYTSDRLVLFFQDQTGFNRFRLTPTSRADFQRVLDRVRRARG